MCHNEPGRLLVIVGIGLPRLARSASAFHLKCYVQGRCHEKWLYHVLQHLAVSPSTTDLTALAESHASGRHINGECTECSPFML